MIIYRLFSKLLDASLIKKFRTMNHLINNIECNAKIPNDLRFAHSGGTIIGSGVKLGKGVVIGQNVTLGWKNGFPTIEDNVKIYENCKIVGGIIVGENSTIGAGSYIDKNIPPNSIVYPKQELIIKCMKLK